MRVCKSLILGILSLCSAVSLDATELKWFTNYEEAKATARENNQCMFVLFTGSDWCGWCVKLENEVLGKADFAERVGEKFVFVKVDFPASLPQSEAVRQQNASLKDRFGIRGFPTVVVQDASERRIATTGYRPGGSAEYAAHLMQELNNYKDIAESVAEPKSAEELQSAYEDARRNGRDVQQQEILSAGLKLEDNGFFLLEKYQQLVESGYGNTDEAKTLAESIRSYKGSNSAEWRYRLAVIEFQGLDDKTHNNPSEAAAPLLSYLKTSDQSESQHAWRVQMMVSQVYRSHGDFGTALKHGREARRLAPEDHWADLDLLIETLEQEAN